MTITWKQLLQAIPAARCTWCIAGIMVAMRIAADAGMPTEALVLHDSLARNLAHPWVLVTTAFVTVGWLHLALNVATLVLAGALYEMRHSGRSTLGLFVTATVAASLMFAAVGAFSYRSGNPEVTLTGCSAGMLGLFCGGLMPRLRIVVIMLAAMEISGLAGPNPGGSLAHVVGIGTGVVWSMRRRGQSEAADDADADVLDKARCSGYASLNPEERRRLRNITESK